MTTPWTFTGRQLDEDKQSLVYWCAEVSAKRRINSLESHIREVLFGHGIVDEKKGTLNGKPIQLVFVTAEHVMVFDALSQIIVGGKIYWEGCF